MSPRALALRSSSTLQSSLTPHLCKLNRVLAWLVAVGFLVSSVTAWAGVVDAGGPKGSSLVWFAHPAEKWENALPVGNGRLGAMVFGKTDEEQIQLNEDTYWSGGPYSTTRTGGHKDLAEIRRLIFAGELVQAHKLFGRSMMGYPVEQQKYQSLGNLMLKFPAGGQVRDYRHELDLDTAIATTTFERDGVRYRREVFASPVDQVIVVRVSADKPGRISFTAQLRGDRNQAHSNYATDYFQMNGLGADGLIVTGKSADYLGVPGALRYQSRLRAIPRGGQVSVSGDTLTIRDADEAILLIAAATNFVNYKDVSADPGARVDGVMRAVAGKSFDQLRAAHVTEHQRLFRRVRISLGRTANADLPTDERLKAFDGTNDPDLAALVFQFGRYLLISSSRP
ncbi:MAG: glycoside hydrolase family 95 protein, partial [Vicinamibacteria bacterium]